MAMITVNGESTELCAGMTILSFLALHGVDDARVVVEHNFEIVPLDRWDLSQLADGDNLEIVKFLGGG